MRKLIYILVLSLELFTCPQISKAQITLEQTFNTMVFFSGTIIDSNGDFGYYVFTDNTKNEIKLFNIDYSLYKTIVIVPPIGYNINNYTYYPSITLFNSDGKIEVLVVLVSTTTPSDLNLNNGLRLYNEDGVLLKDFGYSYIFSPSVHQISNNQYRLALVKYIYGSTVTYKTEVYSLPGSIISNTPAVKSSAVMSPFPNPANSIINLPYKLAQRETAIMEICDIQGKLIEQKLIDSQFDKILLNVSNYNKGTYIYQVNGVSKKFIVQ